MQPVIDPVEPPGGYRDGPVYLRVNRRLAGSRWSLRAYPLQPAGLNGHVDPGYEYVRAENSHTAFAYREWMRSDGVPEEALSVVRITFAS